MLFTLWESMSSSSTERKWQQAKYNHKTIIQRRETSDKRLYPAKIYGEIMMQ